MKGSSVGLALILLGLAILVVFATADLVGLGADPRFGPKQISGSAAGLVIAAVGGLLYRANRARSR